MSRDGALEAWGRLGIIEEVAKRTRCRYDRCAQRKRRGHTVVIAPYKAKLGSVQELDALVRKIQALKPNRRVE